MPPVNFFTALRAVLTASSSTKQERPRSYLRERRQDIFGKFFWKVAGVPAAIAFAVTFLVAIAVGLWWIVFYPSEPGVNANSTIYTISLILSLIGVGFSAYQSAKEFITSVYLIDTNDQGEGERVRKQQEQEYKLTVAGTHRFWSIAFTRPLTSNDFAVIESVDNHVRQALERQAEIISSTLWDDASLSTFKGRQHFVEQGMHYSLIADYRVGRHKKKGVPILGTERPIPEISVADTFAGKQLTPEMLDLSRAQAECNKAIDQYILDWKQTHKETDDMDSPEQNNQQTEPNEEPLQAEDLTPEEQRAFETSQRRVQQRQTALAELDPSFSISSLPLYGLQSPSGVRKFIADLRGTLTKIEKNTELVTAYNGLISSAVQLEELLRQFDEKRRERTQQEEKQHLDHQVHISTAQRTIAANKQAIRLGELKVEEEEIRIAGLKTPPSPPPAHQPPKPPMPFEDVINKVTAVAALDRLQEALTIEYPDQKDFIIRLCGERRIRIKKGERA